MIRKIQSVIFNKNFDFSLTERQQKQIQHTIKDQNWRRGRILFAVMLLMEIALILFYDLPSLKTVPAHQRWSANAYLILHILLGITNLTGVITAFILLRKPLEKRGGLVDFYTAIFVCLLLTLLSMINSVDQVSNNQISVFIIGLLVPGVMVILRPPLNYIVYTIPYLVFLAGLFIFQSNPTFLIANIVNGSVFYVCVLIISRFIYENQVSHLIKNIKLEEANQQLVFLSAYDPLTRLSNRRNFEEHLNQTVINPSEKNSVILILIDIDHFKNVNDQFGHPAGDEVLQEVAAIIQNNVREEDLAARWGGEEFLIMIRGYSLQQGKQLGERLRKTIAERTFLVNENSISVTVSIGVAFMSTQLETFNFQQTYHQVDQALYRAKEQGRNTVVVFE